MGRGTASDCDRGLPRFISRQHRCRGNCRSRFCQSALAFFGPEMLNSAVMMIKVLPKTMVCLLLSTLMIINAADAIGYAWCFGGDGHVKIKYVTAGSCCEQESALPDPLRLQPADASLRLSGGESCGPCLDLFLKQNEASIIKRSNKLATPALAIAKTSSSPLPLHQSMVAGTPLTQPPPRVSQTILSHRTVVLLH